jgi:hypothetical protein
MGTARCYIGRLSAYIIEMILGREKLIEPIYPKDFEFMLGPHASNYVYGVGIITKEQGKLIDAKDLVHVQKAYVGWWEKNKDKPIEELRRDWSLGITPLSRSLFSWE